MKIWLRAFISITLIAIIWLTIIYVFLPAVKKVSPPKIHHNTTPIEESKQPGNISNNNSNLIEKESQKPLDLEVIQPNTEQVKDPPVEIEGPQVPKAETQLLPSAEGSILPADLTDEKPKKGELLYNYKGSEDNQHKLMLGVKKGDVTVKTDIQADEKEQTVQQIQIEIKLP